jgi:7-cyano-7-deazaguanine synthase
MTRVLVLHSGGLDSSVCLASAVAEYGAPNCKSISINYGQRHKKEMDYADALCNQLNVERQVVVLPPIKGVMLTDETIEIPNISYDEITGISPTYVPFRNGLMLSNAASIAQHEGFDLLYYGAHSEDAKNWAYPDCTPEFNGAMANAIFIGTYQKTRLITPLQWMLKSEIVSLGTKLGLDFSLTWSCYAGEEHHCGTCPTCRARKIAFQQAGIIDPTVYAE